MGSASKEEGEIEEGELPEEYTSPVDDAPPLSERSPNGYQSPNDTGPATTSAYEPGYSSRPSGYGSYKHSSSSSRYHERDWRRPSSHHSSHSDWGRGDSYREPSSSELLHEVEYLTRNTGITDAIRNLDDVCKRLDSAMSILSSVWKSSDRGASLPSSFAPKAAALHKALRAVHVASGTGAGKTQNMDRAKAAMKSAWHLRERLFTVAQQKELESWITNSKFFKFILVPEPEPAEEKPSPAAAAEEPARGAKAVAAGARAGGRPDEREQGEIEGPSAPPAGHSNGPASAAAGSEEVAAAAAAEGSSRGKRRWDDNGAADDSASEPQQKQQRHAGSRESTPPPASPPLPVITLNEEELARVLQTDARDLLRQGKLCLVLDLDHTLLNSAKFSELAPGTELLLQNRLAHETQAVSPGQRELYRLPMVGMWTKLRPGVRDFLQRAAEKFELWIHTNGNRQYATAVIELLDPEQRYFGSRVITGLGADQGVAAQMTKRLMQGLEGREPVVIIVDDSSAVWPHDLRNLLVVERYLYFPSASGRPGASLLELNRDECPKSGMLKTAIRVIETVHTGVFQRLAASSSNPTPPPSPSAAPTSYPHWDVREVLTSEKRKILAGCNVVFTRVIPLGTDPKHNNYWQLAESYGATCSERLTEETTHVIAAVAGTEKANQARAMGKRVVNLSWLNASCILWQRADESLFELRE